MSEPVFVDTNVFLRLLLDDHEEQSASARRLFDAVEAEDLQLWTSDVAIAELIWVLTGPSMRRDRADVAASLGPILELPGLRLIDEQAVLRALRLFVEEPIDWVDAYHATLLESRGEAQLYSFDRDFDRIPGLVRMEP